MKIYDFLLGTFWVVVTLFALRPRREDLHRQGLLNADSIWKRRLGDPSTGRRGTRTLVRAVDKCW
jgi:hypothetical protein